MSKTQTLEEIATSPPSVARNWRRDQKTGYVAHFIPPDPLDPDPEFPLGRFEGPTDAFVWLGEPHEGSPWRTTRVDPNSGKEYSCPKYLDTSKTSVQIGGVDVEWIEWDTLTGCNVYRRVS